MHRWGIIVALALAACAPQTSAPELVVRQAYDEAVPRLAGGHLTTSEQIPMSPGLRADLEHAGRVAVARNEPFIDGDLIVGCQDCTNLTDVALTTTTPPANGRAVVEARFKLDGVDRVVIWDMMETEEGWRVDNLRSPDGYDLRNAIAQEIALENISCADDRGAEAAAALVAQCTQVSPATRPPCNAANTCAIIEAEITRSCAMLTGNSRPVFCGR